MTHVDDSGRSVTPASEEGLRHDLARLLAAQPPPDWDTEDAEDAGLECSLRCNVGAVLDCSQPGMPAQLLCQTMKLPGTYQVGPAAV